MTPAALRLLLDEQGDRIARANGETVPDRTAPEAYASPQEFAALAGMSIT